MSVQQETKAPFFFFPFLFGLGSKKQRLMGSQGGRAVSCLLVRTVSATVLGAVCQQLPGHRLQTLPGKHFLP